jgi:hypothetical protein
MAGGGARLYSRRRGIRAHLQFSLAPLGALAHNSCFIESRCNMAAEVGYRFCHS